MEISPMLSEKASDIFTMLEAAVVREDTPGFAAFYMENQDSQTVWGGTIDDVEEVTSSSLYDLASLTKVVGTTTRILQLIDHEEISLSDSIGVFFPVLAELQITIQDLLLHRAGFPADFTDKTDFSQEFFWNFLKKINLPLPHERHTIYSDIGYLLLGEIIEKIDGCGLEESFRTHIFESLGMASTTYFPDESAAVPTEITKSRGKIKGNVHDGKAFLWGREAGHAGLFSTVGDLEGFVRAVFSGDLLSDELLTTLQTFVVSGRTLGWLSRGAGQLYHTGFTGGLICLDLLQRRALVVLSNRTYPSRENKDYTYVRQDIIEKFFQRRH
ncbi:serine hydrolase domain-containing protein [Lactococcus muris]